MYIAAMARILIVDDNPWNSEVAQLLLQRAGHDVTQAIDAAAGLALARRDTPDLVLMDLNLPGMDGLTAARSLKQDAVTCRIRVFAFTPMDSDEQSETIIKEILASGCDGVVPKNVSPGEFIAAVNRALELTHPA